MKVAIASDHHIDAVTAGVERWPEIREHFALLAQWGADNKGSVLLLLGDFFDPGGRMDCQRAARIINVWVQLRLLFDCTIWLAGNHDVLEVAYDNDVVTTISPLAAAAYDDQPRMHGRTIVAQWPCYEERIFGDSTAVLHEVGFVLLPFVAAAVRRVRAVGAAEDNALLEARAALCKDDWRKVVVAGHRTIAGVVPGSEDDMPRGGDYPFPEAALQLYRDFPGRVVLANGHYHEPQTFMLDGCPIIIPGCPFRATFGELGGPDRGFVVVDTDELRAPRQ